MGLCPVPLQSVSGESLRDWFSCEFPRVNLENLKVVVKHYLSRGSERVVVLLPNPFTTSLPHTFTHTGLHLAEFVPPVCSTAVYDV